MAREKKKLIHVSTANRYCIETVPPKTPDWCVIQQTAVVKEVVVVVVSCMTLQRLDATNRVPT